MKRKLLVATRNFGKVKEFADMLGELDVAWVGLQDLGVSKEVEETGTTFDENANLKAMAYAKLSGQVTLADDSGLEVDALNGAPGVYTARYGGAGLSHAQRYELLLHNMIGVPQVFRTARFRCVIALADQDGTLLGNAAGICHGEIAFAPSGTHGFGYDPVFFLPQFGLTMAQLEPDQKHAISHRGKALKNIEPLIRELMKR